tara:strand:- start:9 stop:731 length:723 start_codon:yes stop_codon:yes gene_type:complete
VSYLSTRELVDKKLTITNVITCLISGFITISPFIIYEIFNTNIYLKNFIFYLISLIIILNLFLPIIFNKQNIISNKFYKLIFPILLPSILMIYGSIILIENKHVFLLLIIISTLNDSSAYATGKVFGKHSLSKNISPGKTVEGSIGGIIVTTVLSLAIIKWNMSPFYLVDANIFYIIFSIILLSIFGQIGDLFFSKIKRINKIKDFGNIFPGHGGVLDRIDSSLFIFMLGYFVLLKWINL